MIQGAKDSIYPHSLVLSDGNAMNMKEVLFIALKEDIEPYLLRLDTGFISYSLEGSNSDKQTKKANEILEILNKDFVVYRNPLLFSEAIKGARRTQLLIRKGFEEKRH